LLEHCRAKGYQVVAVIAEQGSGLNEKRKGLHRILRLAREGKMDLLVVETGWPASVSPTSSST